MSPILRMMSSAVRRSAVGDLAPLWSLPRRWVGWENSLLETLSVDTSEAPTTVTLWSAAKLGPDC